MTMKENLIKIIIDIDERKAKELFDIVTKYMWNNIEEVAPTDDEIAIISAFENGVGDYVIGDNE